MTLTLTFVGTLRDANRLTDQLVVAATPPAPHPASSSPPSLRSPCRRSRDRLQPHLLSPHSNISDPPPPPWCMGLLMRGLIGANPPTVKLVTSLG